MQKELIIKGKAIGEGKPLICVPVMDRKKEDIVEEVKRLIDLGVEMVEWRVDAFEEVNSLNAVREVLNELKPLVEHTILLYTFRSKEQGGMCEMSYGEMYDLHQAAAETKIVDLVDVEYFKDDYVDKEIGILQKMGVKVITSHHDFYGTPQDDVIFVLLEKMTASGADIIKLAVMPQSAEDVLTLLSETNRFHKEYPKLPLITMSMGKLGAVSRICGETFGSCVTFGAGKNASAPGQIQAEKLKGILETLH
uniref:type I 3-dehydroquinate dehydratase n=1 Tax=Agathobacter sp. TaxID=2021311 RepID=UPI00405605E4